MLTAATYPVQPPGELAALRARVAELKAQLAGRDTQLAAAQARLAVLKTGHADTEVPEAKGSGSWGD
jgi:hypothetical protein